MTVSGTFPSYESFSSTTNVGTNRYGDTVTKKYSTITITITKTGMVLRF